MARRGGSYSYQKRQKELKRQKKKQKKLERKHGKTPEADAPPSPAGSEGNDETAR